MVNFLRVHEMTGGSLVLINPDTIRMMNQSGSCDRPYTLITFAGDRLDRISVKESMDEIQNMLKACLVETEVRE